MSEQLEKLPSMPEIGRPEAYYARKVHQAEARGDRNAREAYKVGQYITLALNPELSWEAKQRYFSHALDRHCQCPPVPDEQEWVFYHELSGLVRQYAGQEALRMASEEDNLYYLRLKMGQDREAVESDAEIFFTRMMGRSDRCPPWFIEEDWQQLKIIRDNWI